jgi:imidazolonepropionase-like amidohydrolase
MNHRHVRRVMRSVFAGVLGFALIFPAAVHAQFTEAPAPAAYALRNVTVVRPDGSSETGQTLVVRAERIETLARGAAVPGDARVLDGDSLYVYPGFIDAAGTVAYEFPRDTTDRSRVRSWDPPRTLRGYMPSRRVVDHMSASASDVAALRKKGIVAVAAHPPVNEPLMSGRGVFVLLRAGAAASPVVILRPELAPLMSLRGSRGMYPSTQMGVLAWYRQTFMDAQHQLAGTQSANGDAAGPAQGFDADMNVVQELLRTNGRVYFVANDANEIRRVLTLAGEFRFRPVIVGGAEAWRVADDLKAANVPVLVSVDFPKPRRWKPDAKPKEGEETEPLDPAAAREKNQLEAAYANAGRLAQAGVTFALVSGGRADLLEGAVKVVEYGLSETDALRALTATPAALLDAPQLARVQAGAAATFIVADRPVLTEDARIVYAFVDGVLEKGADAKRTSTADSASADGSVSAAGTWTVDVLAPQTQTFTMKLTQDGSSVSGTMDSPDGSVPVSGTIEGTKLSLRGTLVAGGQSIEIEMTGDITGDEASGRVSTPMGEIDWKARRTGPGARP